MIGWRGKAKFNGTANDLSIIHAARSTLERQALLLRGAWATMQDRAAIERLSRNTLDEIFDGRDVATEIINAPGDVGAFIALIITDEECIDAL